MSVVMPYNAMFALPDVLTPAADRVREILRTGWRPPIADGPTRDELAAIVRAEVEPVGPAPLAQRDEHADGEAGGQQPEQGGQLLS